MRRRVLLLAIVAAVAAGIAVVEDRTAPAAGGRMAGEPAWSPSGTQIVFSVDDLNIYVIGVDGRGLRDVTRGIWRTSNPAWSPDGRLIAFDGPDPGTALAALYVMNSSGSGRRLIAHAAREPAWSPDGRSIVYWIEDYGVPDQLAVVTPAGRRTATIKLGRSLALRFPFWSPDGRSIAFAADGGNGPTYVVNRDGSHLRVLAALGWKPVWSPDWRHVIYRGGRGLRVASFPVHGARQLTRPLPGEVDEWPAWSRDGKRIAFVRTEGSNSASLYVIDADGNGLKKLFP